MSDEEELPLQSNDTSQTHQSHISSNQDEDHIDPTNQNINEPTNPNNDMNDTEDDIQVIDSPTNSNNPQEDDETQNLIHISNDDYIDVTVDTANTPNTDNDSKNNPIPTDNDSNQSNQSNNGYIVVDMAINNDKQNTENININPDNDIINITTENKQNIPTDNEDELLSDSEPKVTSELMKASILTTWVPKNPSATELTVIAGDIVTVMHSDLINLNDNPLAMGDNNFDKIIILNAMHWTQIKQRSGKIGIVPSNILGYENNPINNVWIKVRIQHSYMAKANDQLSITSNEKLQIYGCLNDDGMIKAKRKHGETGLIPWNFVEIPSAVPNNDMNNLNTNPQYRTSNSSISNDNLISNNNNMSRSRHSSMGTNDNNNNKGHHIQSSSLKFTIDETITNITANDNLNSGISNALVLNNNNSINNKKAKLTNKIKAIGSSISTAIDKIQYASYSHGVNKTLEPMNVNSNLASPSGKTKSYDSDRVMSDNNSENISGYEWSAPLQWKKVYVLKDFNATKEEIGKVYSNFILDKQARGRNESILSYDEQNENDIIKHKQSDHDPYNAAVPSKAKKTEKDVIKINTIDMIEITGQPSPEGWVLARFINHKSNKGFVPIQCLQLLNENKNNPTGGIGAALQQQQQLNNNTQIDNENGSVGTGTGVETTDNEIVSPPMSSPQTSPTEIDDGNLTDKMDNNNNFDIIPRSKQPLPFHWPFSTYLIKKRSKKSKIIETIGLGILFIIYLLPVLVEEPKPENAPKKYNIWWINLFLVWLPWTGIYVLRILELWSKIFLIDVNPNNKLYGTLLFYIILIVYFFGLFAIVIEVSIQYEWIRDNSPVLLLATVVEILVFITCVTVLIFGIIFILVWTFCCRISRNRWETRIEFYCCTRGDAVKTKRYPRAQK